MALDLDMQHHAAVELIVPLEQRLHFIQFRRLQLGHKADVADIDAEQRQLILRRRPGDAQHGAVSAQNDSGVRDADCLGSIHVIERHHLIMQRVHGAPHLIGQDEANFPAPELLADRRQNFPRTLLAQIGVDEKRPHQLSSSSCA